MEASQLITGSAVWNGLSSSKRKSKVSSDNLMGFRGFVSRVSSGNSRNKDARCVDVASQSLNRAEWCLNNPFIRQRAHVLSRLNNHLNSDCVKSCDDEDSSIILEESDPSNSNGRHRSVSLGFIGGNGNLRKASTDTFQPINVRRELLTLSLPAIGGQALEPLGQLMETAFIGHLGSVELASAGVSLSLFNIVSKLFNIPLLSVATSFVAEDISKNAVKFSTSERLQLSSVSTALLLAVGIGIFEAIALSLGSGPLLSLMGISPVSSMRGPAQRFLIIRALGAPAFVVSLALQGIFRGFKNMTTPIYCLGVGNFTAIFLYPLLMYCCRMGVEGAAISTVISQYIVAFSMIWNLNKRAFLLPPKLGELQFDGYLKSGGFLVGRTLSVLLTMTLATSMAARQGPTAMAAHQICLQIWLAVSLLTDALAASAQTLTASYISRDDYTTVKDLTQFVLKMGSAVGVFLALILGASFSSLTPLFTKETQVLEIVRTASLYVCASQPLNALAFILDGLHFGVSDFRYAAISMMLVGAISCTYLLSTPFVSLSAVWLGLTLFMGLRMVAGFFRLLTPRGPWWFMHNDFQEAKVTV